MTEYFRTNFRIGGRSFDVKLSGKDLQSILDNGMNTETKKHFIKNVQFTVLYPSSGTDLDFELISYDMPQDKKVRIFCSIPIIAS